MDKHDVVREVRARLAGEPDLLAQFNWLLKMWNTDDDRSYEEFDPTAPYGAEYESAEADADSVWHCEDCGFEGEPCEFEPTDGNPAPHVCPECARTNVFGGEAES